MDIGLIHLPLEILSNICSRLDSITDVPHLRQVCRAFNNAASPFLISKTCISPHVEDLQRLTSISQHSVFSKSVREIEYHATTYDFEFYKKEDYLHNIRFHDCSLIKTPKDSNTEPTKFINAAILRGHEEHQKRCLHQTDLSRHNGEHMTVPDDIIPPALTELVEAGDIDSLESYLPSDLVCLVRALRSMPLVERLTIGDLVERPSHYWCDRTKSRREGFTFSVQKKHVKNQESVLIDSRSWHDVIEDMPRRHMNGMPPHHIQNWYRGFHVLTQAASMTGKKNLKSFIMGSQSQGLCSGISYQIFQMSPSQITHTCNAFRYLTELDLKMSHPRQTTVSNFQHYRAIKAVVDSGNIARCLSAAHNLHSLSLEFMGSGTHRIEIENLATILGDFTWPKLHSVSLRNMRIHQSEFVYFVLRHKASLRSLVLHEVFVLGCGDPHLARTWPLSSRTDTPWQMTELYREQFSLGDDSRYLQYPESWDRDPSADRGRILSRYDFTAKIGHSCVFTEHPAGWLSDWASPV